MNGVTVAVAVAHGDLPNASLLLSDLVAAARERDLKDRPNEFNLGPLAPKPTRLVLWLPMPSDVAVELKRY